MVQDANLPHHLEEDVSVRQSATLTYYDLRGKGGAGSVVLPNPAKHRIGEESQSPTLLILVILLKHINPLVGDVFPALHRLRDEHYGWKMML